MYKKILVPTDGSPLSEQAAATAIEFARAHGGALVAMSVAQPFPSMASEAAVVTDAAMESDPADEAGAGKRRQGRAAGQGGRGAMHRP